MRSRQSVLLFVALVVFCRWPALGAEALQPGAGPVRDQAGVLSSEDRGDLEDLFATTRKNTGYDFILIVASSAGGLSVEDHAQKLFQSLPIPVRDHTLILFAAMDAHQARWAAGPAILRRLPPPDKITSYLQMNYIENAYLLVDTCRILTHWMSGSVYLTPEMARSLPLGPRTFRWLAMGIQAGGLLYLAGVLLCRSFLQRVMRFLQRVGEIKTIYIGLLLLTLWAWVKCVPAAAYILSGKMSCQTPPGWGILIPMTWAVVQLCVAVQFMLDHDAQRSRTPWRRLLALPVIASLVFALLPSGALAALDGGIRTIGLPSIAGFWVFLVTSTLGVLELMVISRTFQLLIISIKRDKDWHGVAAIAGIIWVSLAILIVACVMIFTGRTGGYVWEGFWTLERARRSVFQTHSALLGIFATPLLFFPSSRKRLGELLLWNLPFIAASEEELTSAEGFKGFGGGASGGAGATGE